MTSFVSYRKGSTRVLEVNRKNLDAGMKKPFIENVLAAIGDGFPVLVDLSAIEFVDTSGLGAILEVGRQAAPGYLRIVGTSRGLIAGLARVPQDRLPPWHGTVAEALLAINDSDCERKNPSRACHHTEVSGEPLQTV